MNGLEITLTITGIILVLFIILILSNMVYYRYKNVNYSVDNKKTLEELTELIKFHCDITYKNKFLPLFDDRGYTIDSAKRNVGKIINDNYLNESIVETTQTILICLSKDFKDKLFLFINQNYLEKFILTVVSNNLTQLARDLNGQTIKKIHNA